MDFGSKELSDYARDYLLAQVTLLYDAQRAGLLSGRAAEIAAAVCGLANTASAIAILGDRRELFVRECVMLSRGLFESLVNVCYLLVCDSDAFGEYRLHTMAKAERRLDQEFRAGNMRMGLRFIRSEGTPLDSDVAEALRMFSAKNGAEKKRWPSDRIPERIALIGERSQANTRVFLMYQVVFYTDASEALHGTFYGQTFHLGQYSPGVAGRGAAEARRNAERNATLLFWGLGELFCELLVVVHECSDVAQARAQARANSRQVLAIIDAANRGSVEPSAAADGGVAQRSPG
jgi:hypothetical protein